MGLLEVCTAECKRRIKSLVLLIPKTLNMQNSLPACSLFDTQTSLDARKASSIGHHILENDALNPSHSSNTEILAQLCLFISTPLNLHVYFNL